MLETAVFNVGWNGVAMGEMVEDGRVVGTVGLNSGPATVFC